MPAGTLGGRMAATRWSVDLLKEVGFDFLMDWPNDDQPIWMKTRSGLLMSVPYPIEINDSPQILVRHHTGEDFRDMIIGQFEELLRQSARQPLVCGIALHTMIVGQPYRLRALREALRKAADDKEERLALADLYLSDGRTVHEAITEDLANMYETGKVPLLLGGKPR